MDSQIDIRSWKVFRSLDSAFVANIRIARAVGVGEAGIIVMKNDDVFSMGHGRLLGIKDTFATEVPMKVPEISGLKIKGIDSGEDFVVILTENGQLFTWGSNVEGQLGLGRRTESTPVPTRLHVPNNELVVEVACGHGHTLALTDSGKVYSWGWKYWGQRNKLLSEKFWKPVDPLIEDGLGRSKVVSIACAAGLSCVLRSNGQVWAWGYRSITGLRITFEPTMVPVDVEVTKVVCAYQNVLLLDKEGHLYFWGRHGPTNLAREPTAIASELGQVLDIAASWHTSLNVCRTESGIYFWGPWLGQDWKCPSESNFSSMDLVFAVDNKYGKYSIMYRPWLMPEQKELLTTGCSEQFNSPASADVQFKMQDDRVLHAHQLVLRSRSPYFHKKFNEDWKEHLPLGVTKISVESVDPDSFYSFIHYLYKGRLDKEALPDGPGRYKRTLEILRTSHKYGQTDLFTECKDMLISLVNIENACELFQVAIEFQLKDLEDRILEAMAPPNFYKIVQTDAPAEVIKLIAKKLCEREIEEKALPKVRQFLPLVPSTRHNPICADNFFKI